MKEENHCWFCHRPIPESETICEREECRELDRELEAAIKWSVTQEFRLGVIAALKQRAKADQDWELNRLQRWFYTLKLFACILFRLRYHGEEYFPHSVEVAYYPMEPVGWHNSWRMMQVGHGYFKGWWWAIESD